MKQTQKIKIVSITAIALFLLFFTNTTYAGTWGPSVDDPSIDSGLFCPPNLFPDVSQIVGANCSPDGSVYKWAPMNASCGSWAEPEPGQYGADVQMQTCNPESNTLPVVNAGSDQTITLPTSSVTLSGTASDPDPGGSVASVAWSRAYGPNFPTIVSPNSYTTTVNGLVEGHYTFAFTATDNLGAVNVDYVSIQVNPAPVLPSDNVGLAFYYYCAPWEETCIAAANIWVNVSVNKLTFSPGEDILVDVFIFSDDVPQNSCPPTLLLTTPVRSSGGIDLPCTGFQAGVNFSYTFVAAAPSSVGPFDLWVAADMGPNYLTPAAKNIPLSVAVGNYTLTTTVNPVSGGSVSNNLGTYAAGTWAGPIAATANGGYSFSSWSGACAGQGSSCSILMDGNKSTTANFVATCVLGPLDGGIETTNTDCLNAMPAQTCAGVSGATILQSAWSGACVPPGGLDCGISGGSLTAYSAIYTCGAGSVYTLTVNSSGASTVPITANPTTYNGTTNYAKPGIAPSTSITLTAPATSGAYTFSSWTGCSSVTGTYTCNRTMDANRTVTANYTATTYTLSVNSSGASSVAITSTSGDGGTTNYTRPSLASGSSRVLTAPATSGAYTFSSWTGCSSVTGTYTCNRTMDANRTVTANYTALYTLTTTVNPVGSGSVSNNLGTYAPGTWANPIATPGSGYSFSSWSDACSGQPSSCLILMDGDKSATANFVLAPSFDYSLSNSGMSSVTKTAGDAYTTNTVTKTLTPGSTESVNLSVSGLPDGVIPSISNQGCSPTCTSTITFTVANSTAAGDHTVTITGTPLNRTTNFTLRVIAPTSLSVTCSANLASVLLGEDVTWSATVVGGTAPFTYSWAGTDIPTLPAPTTNPYIKSYSTIGQKSAAVTVDDDGGFQATCSPAAVTQVNFDPLFEEF